MHSGRTGTPSSYTLILAPLLIPPPTSMAAAREKLKAHRKRKLEKTSVKLVQPITIQSEKIKEKIKVAAKSRSALVSGEGRSMGMEID